jgi:hypothetical protein
LEAVRASLLRLTGWAKSVPELTNRHLRSPAIRRMTERASSGRWGQDSMSLLRPGWSWRVGAKFDAKSLAGDTVSA